MTALAGRRSPIALVAVGAVALFLSGCSIIGPLVPADEPVRDEDGLIVEPNEQTDAFTLVVGDCLDDAEAQGEITTVPTVPCSDPHDSEIYAAFELTGSAYPGEDTVTGKAEVLCLPAFEEFVGEPYLDSRFDFAYYYPTAESWASGDREVLCVIYDPAGPVTGSLRGVTD